MQEDPSGLCPVTYRVSGTEIEKHKELSKCVNHKDEKFTALSEVSRRAYR